MLPQGPLTAQAVLICHPGTKPNKADDQPAMLSTSVLTGNPQPGSDCHSTTKLLLCIWDAHKAERVPWWRCILYKVTLCRPWWPRSLSLTTSASREIRLQLCTTISSLCYICLSNIYLCEINIGIYSLTYKILNNCKKCKSYLQNIQHQTED